MKIKKLRSNYDSDLIKHPSMEAWENSRPNNSPLELGKILSLDLPVNEIPTITLFIESTILEREIITTLRNHVMWAQTSRVQNILEFEYPDELWEHSTHFEDVREQMINEADNGIRQDSYRRKLPIMSNCKYTVNLSMRDMIHLYKFFCKISKENPHLSDIFDSSCTSFYGVLSNVFAINSIHIDSYKQRPILNTIERSDSGLVGDTLVINANLPISLRAQLVRHRALHIQDNLLELMSDKSIMKKDNEMIVNVQVSGLVSDWTEIIRKRSCWIAQYDLWKEILDKAEKFLNLGTSGLPCHSGSCPFDGDADARYTKEDPNAPCPIHAKLSLKPLSSQQIIECKTQYSLDKRPEFWLKEIENFCHES